MSLFRNLTNYAERHLVATSSTTQYAWFTGWQSANGIDNIRAVLKAKNAGAVGALPLQWQLAIQYAEVRADAPGSPSVIGTAQTAGTIDYQTGDISVATNMAANRLFRLGVAYSSASNAVVQGDVSLVASWKSVATELGRVRMMLGAVDTGVKYEVLTDWMPATFMSKIKAAFILNSLTSTSNFRYQLAYQTAGTSVQQPSGWTNAEPSGWVTPSVAYNERNTGDIAVTTTTDMWFRLGLAYGLTSGVDANVTAWLDAILSCR